MNPYSLANRRNYGLQIVQGQSHILLSLPEVKALLSDLQEHVANACGQKRAQKLDGLQAAHHNQVAR